VVAEGDGLQIYSGNYQNMAATALQFYGIAELIKKNLQWLICKISAQSCYQLMFWNICSKTASVNTSPCWSVYNTDSHAWFLE